jgi:predicted ATPase with chaperone activity
MYDFCYSILDEYPEFGSRVLQVMRQPMEDKQVTITRVIV